jgi:hypothetical protein
MEETYLYHMHCMRDLTCVPGTTRIMGIMLTATMHLFSEDYSSKKQTTDRKGKLSKKRTKTPDNFLVTGRRI